MSGDGKRSVAEWPKLPRPSSTLPKGTWYDLRLESVMRSKADIDCLTHGLTKKPRRPSTGFSSGERREITNAPLNRLCHDSGCRGCPSPDALIEIDHAHHLRVELERAAAAEAKS